jgi:nucleolar MIF4G domain-containing protein 1
VRKPSYHSFILLKVSTVSGRQLRQDDPLALKDIVQLVSENTSHRKEDLRFFVSHSFSMIILTLFSSRTRFMIETLTNLKNNRSKKLEANGTDTVERMRKFLAGLGKKHHGTSQVDCDHSLNNMVLAGREPLRVSLEDLHSAESKGKWWLVGAGWTGDPLVDNKRSRENEGPDGQSERGTESQKMMDLAKKQGMNTDVRRSVFIVLMSSDVSRLVNRVCVGY